jgi:nucleoside-diphosphate-sugar epimerase
MMCRIKAILTLLLLVLLDPILGDILILGSGGLIGSALTEELTSQGYTVLEIKGRNHIDIRNKTAFLQFVQGKQIEFVFFLACEVGGSKFIESSSNQVQRDIIESNLKMYDSVLPWLQQEKIPFLFASSSLQSKRNAYGVIKRLGEIYVEAIGVGKSVRLWNIFGKEPFGLRSRVITDWINGCIRDNKIQALTNGLEFRKFMYSVDCAKGLIKMMEIYPELDQVTDLTSQQWTQMKDLAQIISSQSPRECQIEFSDRNANLDRSDPPDTSSALYRSGWAVSYSLEYAISELYLYFNCQTESECLKNSPYQQ